MKRALAEEVRRQMKEAKTDQAAGEAPEAASALPAIFTDHGPRVFLVSASMTGVTLQNSEVPLPEGDVLGLTVVPDPGEEYTRVRVLAAHGPGCPRGSVVMVKTEDLVESLNQLQATVDQGLEKLRTDAAGAKPGKGGAAFPRLPADAGRNAAFLKEVRTDPAAVAEFASAAKETDLAEKAVLYQADHPERETMVQQVGLDDQDRWDAAAARVKVNMAIGEVDRLLGKPDRQASGLDKRTYIYQKGQMKINFNQDRVTEITRW